jgi:SagB-type dehydrogenase family enzyme
VKQHALEELMHTDTMAQEFANCFVPDWIQEGKCAIIVTAVFFRTQIKYSDRGYRHILLEAGHFSQNLALLAGAMDVSCCSCGGFVDDAINALLDVDGREEAAISTMILG